MSKQDAIELEGVVTEALFISFAPDSYCCRVLRFMPLFLASMLWE